MDKEIIAFLENKKQDYLKKKVNNNTSEEDKSRFTQEAPGLICSSIQTYTQQVIST